MVADPTLASRVNLAILVGVPSCLMATGSTPLIVSLLDRIVVS